MSAVRSSASMELFYMTRVTRGSISFSSCRESGYKLMKEPSYLYFNQIIIYIAFSMRNEKANEHCLLDNPLQGSGQSNLV